MASLEPLHRSIVINREFGSGGREIGRRIAERTGAPVSYTHLTLPTSDLV